VGQKQANHLKAGSAKPVGYHLTDVSHDDAAQPGIKLEHAQQICPIEFDDFDRAGADR
jgi:hypothetical protein